MTENNNSGAAFEVVGEATASMDESGNVTIRDDRTYLYSGAPVGSIWGTTKMGVSVNRRWMVVGAEEASKNVVVLPVYEAGGTAGVPGRWDRQSEAFNVVIPVSEFGEFWHDETGIAPDAIVWNLGQYAVWQTTLRGSQESRLRDMAERNQNERNEHEAFKASVTAAAHKYADDNRLCSEFDDLMEEIGLPRRRRTYTVTLSVSLSLSVDVEAESEDKAREIAESDGPEGDYSGLDKAIAAHVRSHSYEREVTDVEEID